MAEWLGISGSRDYRHLERVRGYIADLPSSVVLVFGDARGVDAQAKQAAIFYERHWQMLPAHFAYFGKAAGPWRNEAIVRCVDRVVCFWDGASRGTRSVIDLAERYGKPCEVISDDD